MSYKISKSAQGDLINIWEYTLKNWSVAQADTYYQILLNTMLDLGQHPSLGKCYESFRKGYRGFNIKSHIIFYKEQKDKPIEIIRILHQRMDLKNRIRE